MFGSTLTSFNTKWPSWEPLHLHLKKVVLTASITFLEEPKITKFQFDHIISVLPMLIEQLGNLLSFFHHTVVNLSNSDITYNTNIMEYNMILFWHNLRKLKLS